MVGDVELVEGYYRAMGEAGIPVCPGYIQAGDFRFMGSQDAAAALLKCTPPPTAVFAFNDMMAIGAMTAIRNSGLAVPEDISIVGFDNIELAAAITPTLTTIAQPIDEIARCATDLLIQRLKGSRKEANRRVILQAELVKRESTARRQD